jgi:hypothetical protein
VLPGVDDKDGVGDGRVSRGKVMTIKTQRKSVW